MKRTTAHAADRFLAIELWTLSAVRGGQDARTNEVKPGPQDPKPPPTKPG